MPIPSLKPDWVNFQNESGRLLSLSHSLSSLGPNHRKLVAEIVLLRLFLLTENTIASMCPKLLCGAAYMDNTMPKNLQTATNISKAKALISAYGRSKAVRYPKWSTAKFIKGNMKYTLDQSDPFFLSAQNHGQSLDEMRRVRNQIAHRSSSTREQFRQVVKKHYGGLKPGVSPGLMLISGALGPTTILSQYFGYCRVAVKEIARA